MDLIQMVIEARVGLAGFAGVTVALSGDPRNLSVSEKLRIGYADRDLPGQWVCIVKL